MGIFGVTPSVTSVIRLAKRKSTRKELETIIIKVISDNKDKVEQYKSGKNKLFGFFVGQAMKKTKGKANPKMLNDILLTKLS